MIRLSSLTRQLLVPSFQAKQLTKSLVPNPPPLPPMQGVKFGTIFTPHVLIIDYHDGRWGAPQIEPLADFSIPPQSSVLHYGMSCFEGMKAYADIEDIEKCKSAVPLGNIQRLRLFRPRMNISRLQSSMHRLYFPSFDIEEFYALLSEYVVVEKNYVPKEYGYSLYLRPTAIGLSQSLGAVPSTIVRLYVIASPVGPYYPPLRGKSGAGAMNIFPLKILVEEHYKRAWPGGTGGYKLGANYAGPMLAQAKAHAAGYDQVLWLGAHNEVQEVGSMNFCVLWRTPPGQLELVTAPLDGTILPGVTRDTVLAMVRHWGEYAVSERNYTIDELVAAIQEGRVVECFGCGTAAIVSPVCALNYRGIEYPVPCPENGLQHRILEEVLAIQYGVRNSPVGDWSILLKC